MVVIAGDRSGVGKTTVTLALLAALRQRGASVQSFKVGPDYIDPMFHRYVTGRACRNLDPVLTSEAYVRNCFDRHAPTADYALVEGVMGLFDGATGASDWASTAHIARLLQRPILLVLDCSRLSRSIAAIVHGYRSFDPGLEFAGVVLNRVGSDRHLDLLKTALEPLNISILGVLRRHEEITIPDRHLGLVPTAELPEMEGRIDRLASLAESCFDWARLLPLLAGCKEGKQASEREKTHSQPGFVISESLSLNASSDNASAQKPRVAVAFDRAFSFYYADNLELLENLGAELVFWSPLTDTVLPEGVNGLYFGGGFPEVFAAELSENWQARAAVRSAVLAGMPTYAECGGLMYLSQKIVDFSNQSFEMVGVLPTTAQMNQRLTLGYRQATVQEESLLLPKGATVWGHEFHRSCLTQLPSQPLYQLQGYDTDRPIPPEGWHCHQLQASYVHLHWGTTPQIPHRFLKACLQFA